MRHFLRLIFCGFLLSATAKADGPANTVIQAELTQPADMPGFEFKAYVKSMVLDKDNKSDKDDGYYDETFQVTIDFIGPKPWPDGSWSYPDATLTLKCCGALLSLDGSEGGSGTLTIQGPENPGEQIVKSVTVRKPPCNGPTCGKGGAPGTGDPGPMGGGPGDAGMNGTNGSCSSCVGIPSTGGNTIPILRTGATTEIGLGDSAAGYSLGRIVFHKASVDDGSVGPENFTVRAPHPGTKSFVSGFNITQVVSDAAIVSFTYPSGGDSIEVRAYDISAKGAPLSPTAPDGPFAILSGSNPLVTYTFAGLPADTLGRKGISVEKVLAGETPLIWSLWADDLGTSRNWRAESWDGEVTEGAESVAIISTTPAKWTRNLVFSKFRDTVQISKEESDFESAPKGERIVLHIEGNGLRATEYKYYDNQSNPDIEGKLKSTATGYMDGDDFINSGDWTKYEYNASGDIESIYRPCLDLELDPEHADEDNSRLTYHNGSLTIEIVAGQVVSETVTAENDPATVVVPGMGSVEFTGKSSMTTTRSGGYSWSGSFSREEGESLSASANGTGIYHSAEETGSWNAGTKTFNVGAGSARRSWRGNVYHNGTNYVFAANRSTRTVGVSVGGQTVYESEEVYDGSQWEAFSQTEYTYDARRRQTSVTKDGDIISSTVFHSDRAWTETDEHGIARRYETETSSSGETKTTIVYGAGGAANIQTQTVTVRTGLFTTRTTTTTAGTSSRSIETTSEVDLLGREVSSTDKRDRTTTLTYSPDHRVVTTRSPGDIVETVTTFPDGQVESEIFTSNEVPGERNSLHYDYAVDETTGVLVTEIESRHRDVVTPSQWNLIRTTSRSVDDLGNVRSESRPGPNGNTLTTTYGYDSIGRPVSVNTPGLAAQLTDYNAYGEPYRSGKDEDGSEALEENSADPLSETITQYVKIGANWWRETTTRTWVENGAGTTYNSSQRERLGLGADQEMVQTDRFSNTVTTTVSVNRVTQTVTTTADSSLSDLNAVAVSVGGRVTSETSFTNSNAVTYGYDDFGRIDEVNDPATGTTTYSYNGFDQLLKVTDANDKETTYVYYGSGHVNAGSLWSVTDPTNRTVYHAYDAIGRQTRIWGATYPVRYEYNGDGQKVKMHTYRTFQETVDGTVPAAFTADGDVTTWHYHGPTGLLLEKEYADGEKTSYGYNPEGMPSTRRWARGVTTTYTHDNLGRLTGTDYSDTTPDIARTYDRAGRPLTVSGGLAGTRTLSYAGSGSEEYDGGIFDGLTITNNLSSGRPAGQNLANGSTALASNILSYDARGRVGGVSFQSGGQTINTTYGYHATHGRISSVTTGGSATITTAKVWDTVGRLESITTTGAASGVISGKTYQRDDAGRITRGTLPGGSYWTYGYDGKGQVESSAKRLANGTTVYGLGTGYVYDDIGNRLSTESTANLSGQQPIGSVYASNGVNQYTGITHSTDTGGFSHRFVLGEAVSDAAVEVNGSAAARQGDWFAATVKGDTSSGPAWAPVTVKATKTGAGAGGADLTKSSTGAIYIAPSNETLGYDKDGNLTSDGRWTYTWDAENRLISMETNATALQAGVPAKKVEYAYDGDSRRIRRAEPKWNSVTNQFEADSSPMYYVWKDWTLLAELRSAGGTLDVIRSYSWGLDLADSLEQTGNIGSLLAIMDESGSSVAALLPTYDGNGNIIALANAGDATLAVSYDYDAFGKQILRTNHVVQFAPSSDLAKAVDANGWGFSSKQVDQVNGLLYYGYRFYDPANGRWMSRDPVGENGGLNLYVNGANDILNKIDFLGMQAQWAFLTSEYGNGDTGVPKTSREIWDIINGNGVLKNDPESRINPGRGGVDGIVHGVTNDKGVVDYKIKKESDDCWCVEITIEYKLDSLIMYLGSFKVKPADYWLLAAHETNHVQAAFKRMYAIITTLNNEDRVCRETELSAKVAGQRKETEVQKLVDEAINKEGEHDTSDGFGTPAAGKPGVWSGPKY